MNSTSLSHRNLRKLHGGLSCTLQLQIPRRQYSFTPQSVCNLHKILPETLFQIWQDLSLEATGSDTVWGYPIPLMRIAEQLGIPELKISILLAQLDISGYEHMANFKAITFHAPIAP